MCLKRSIKLPTTLPCCGVKHSPKYFDCWLLYIISVIMIMWEVIVIIIFSTGQIKEKKKEKKKLFSFFFIVVWSHPSDKLTRFDSCISPTGELFSPAIGRWVSAFSCSAILLQWMVKEHTWWYKVNLEDTGELSVYLHPELTA